MMDQIHTPQMEGDYERRSLQQIVRRCDYEWTLTLANWGTMSVEGFSPLEFIAQYSNRGVVGSRNFLGEAMVGLRYLLDQWIGHSYFSQTDVALLHSMSGRPDTCPSVDNETGDWLLPAGWYRGANLNAGSPTWITEFDEWLRYFLVGNVWDLPLGKWDFKLCETNDCNHYVLATKKRFCSYSCGSKTRMRAQRLTGRNISGLETSITV